MASTALCLLAAAGGLIGAQPSQGHVEAPFGTAARVTAFVRVTLAPYVWSVEAALTTADTGLLAYCNVPNMNVGSCAEFTTHEGRMTHGQLSTLLLLQAQIVARASQALSSAVSPPLGAIPARCMERALEDLVIAGDQLAGVLSETADAVPPLEANALIGEETIPQRPAPVAYGRRILAVIMLLRRAQGWLETIDHQTGATATLPGFAPGTPSLESWVNLG
jgi:hypothetical protein